jgi:putative ABC transport system permease protein
VDDIALAARLAWRELRGGLREFRIFLACMAIGVAAIAAVGSLSAAVVAGLVADGGRLLGGDVDLRLLHRPVSAEQRAYLDANAARVSGIVELRAMARPVGQRDGRALVELKAVDGPYPLVGVVETLPARPLAELLAPVDGVWGAVAAANLLTRLGIETGARVTVGEATFEIRAIMVKEPDRVATVLSFGPRLMVSADAIDDTGLVQPGSQIHYHYRLDLSGQQSGAWIAALNEAFPKAGWRVRGPNEAAPGVRLFIDRLTLFLTFTGFTVLLVGGIGVGNAVKSYLDGRVATIAMLKCLGAPGRLIFRIYLLQVLILGVVGTAIGLAIGAVLPILGLEIMADRLPVAPVTGFYGEPLALAALFGLLTAATFGLWPVARAREIPAAQLFRDRAAPVAGRPRPVYIAATVIGIGLLAALAFAAANDRFLAGWFVAGALATLAALRGGAGLIALAAARAPAFGGAAGRLALANLHRPGSVTPSVVMSLGLGLSVLVAVALIDGNLSRQVAERLPERAPAFFFINIQPDQVADFAATVAAVPGASGYRSVPTLRARITHIAGVPVEDAEIAAGSQWAVRGDRALTYAAEKGTDAKLVDGAWWPADYSGPPLISLDAGLAEGFGVTVGDTLTLNVLGREVTARIASTREIDWRSLRFDFAIIFAPGTLESAPQTHIAAVEAPLEAEEAVAAATDAFPNISAIRVRDALEAVARILDGIAVAIRGTASVTVLAGALVLAGTVAAGEQRRIYDAVVFKVLGATRRRILGVFLLEYGVLGLATGAVGAVVGTLAAWAVIRFLMQSEWVFLPGTITATVAACIAITLVVGLIGTARALGHKAAAHLRNE